MTKEELKKEAREDVDSLNGVDLVSSTMIAIDKYGAYKIGRYDGYLAGSEPREKRIAGLEQDNKAYEKENARLVQQYNDLSKENAELKTNFKIAKDNEYEYQSLLIKAKEIISEWLRLHNSNTKKTIIKKSENFLKENT